MHCSVWECQVRVSWRGGISVRVKVYQDSVIVIAKCLYHSVRGAARHMCRFCERGAYRGEYQSFSNTTAKAEFLALDTIHVAIGFVDLGGLAASCKLLMEHHRLDAADREGWRLLTAAAGGPLRWVGYEMSAYAVAKSLVLLEMIEQNASVDSLLQVGYTNISWTYTYHHIQALHYHMASAAFTLACRTDVDCTDVIASVGLSFRPGTHLLGATAPWKPSDQHSQQ